MKHDPITRVVPGSRNAVLMIHGIAGSPGHFEPLLPAVPEDWSLYTMLLDGHGGTVGDFSATSMKKWRAQVTEQVNTLLAQYDTLVLVAHSMGTLFAIQAAIDHPERIRGLLLLASPLRIHLPPATVLGGLHLAAGKARRHKVAAAMEGDSSIRHEGKFFSYFRWCMALYGGGPRTGFTPVSYETKNSISPAGRFFNKKDQSKTYIPKKASSPSPQSYSIPHRSVSFFTKMQ